MTPTPPPDRARIKRLRMLAAEPLALDQDLPSLSRLGKYRVLRELAQGAMGVVYEAEDSELKRPVALKILKELAGSKPVGRQRFEREAVTAARLAHPNVVQVFDVGEDQGRLFLAMELVRGRAMSEVLARRELDPRSLLQMLEKAARGVAAAHEAGIVHRDVKPANILVTEEGEPKVGDFGLAHWMDSDTVLTKTGTPLGTPMYMAPEQVRGSASEIGPATDVYALGAILYEILTGRPPHTGDNTAEIYGKILQQDPLRPRKVNTKVDADLETICLKALDAEPHRRYPTAGAFADDLRRHLAGEAILALPPGAMTVGVKWARRHRTTTVVVALLLLVGAWEAVRAGRAKRRDEAARLLEEARPALDKAIHYQYRSDADYDELVRQVDASQRLIEQAIGRAPDLAQAHHLLARTWEIKGWDDLAEASLREAIRLDPGLGAARLRLGRRLLVKAFLERIGDPVDAGPARDEKLAALMQEAVGQIEAASTGRPEEEMPGRLAESLHRYLKGDLEGAIRIAEIAASVYKGRPEVEEFYWLIGLCRVEKSPERMEAFDKAIALCPNYPLALLCRGSERLKMGQFDPALADLGRALQIHPRFKEAWLDRGLAYYLMQERERAISDFTEVIRLDPKFAMAYSNRAGCKMELGDDEGARQDCDEAIRINPRYTVAYLGRAHLRQKTGDLEGALEDYSSAIQHTPSAVNHVRRGEMLVRLERWAAAVADFRKALDIASPDWRDRGRVEGLLASAAARIRDQ